MHPTRPSWRILGLVAVCGAVPLLSAAAESSIEQRIETLENELEELRQAQTRAQAEVEQPNPTGASVRGYAFGGFQSGDNQQADSFNAGGLSTGLHYKYRDTFFFQGELESTTSASGETGIELEYANTTWFVNDHLSIQAGKWLSPVGQFQERLHPTWINKLPNAPAGFGHGGALPLSDVGVQARGGIPLGDNGSQVSYVFGVGNGARIGHHGPELEGFGSDDNSDKSLTGRVGFLPMPNVEVGASFLTATVSGEAGASGNCMPSGPAQACSPTDGDYRLWGIDFAVTPGAWEVRGEYINSELDSLFSRTDHGDAHTTRLPTTEWKAWYLQGAYRLSDLTQHPLASNLETVVRYSDFQVDGFEPFTEGAEERLTVGVNYLFSPLIVGELAFESRDFAAPDRDDDDRIVGQFTYAF